jgi:hypothetical protein
MGEDVSYRVETSPADRVSSILGIVNANRSNLDRAIEELYSYPGAPRSKEEIEQYVNKLTRDLVSRLDGHETKYFPGVSDKDIREKIFPPLKEYIENTHEKVIVSEHGKDELEVGIFYPGKRLSRGEINIHPILVHLYGLEGATKAEVSYGPTSISFSPIRHNAYYKYSGISLGFHEMDIGNLFMDSILELMEKNFTIRDFKIEPDPSRKVVLIQVEKVKHVTESSVFAPFNESLLRATIGSNEGIDKEESASAVEADSTTSQSNELPLELTENLIDARKSASELHRLSGSMFEPYKSLLSERETLIDCLVDAKLHKESFYKKLTEEWHKVGDILETEPLGKSEYTTARLFIQSIATDIINYVGKREKEINELRQKLARANAR